MIHKRRITAVALLLLVLLLFAACGGMEEPQTVEVTNFEGVAPVAPAEQEAPAAEEAMELEVTRVVVEEVVVGEAAEAMGATKWQVIRQVVLPAAKNGLVSAVLLGIGRGFG